ncbi:alpha/beta fold hydrolase [Patulibacter sp.]|uniref:alpha/beta fold hydrolase n=1 Tax=Patulibacter sp. TaxID=1912859 RepID=UPI002728C56B|nr:alpha/beta hydrolase [Patulibacter sp.]MDO9407168.1 alpha/beta hydrolase [Patulibacter sp.]
MVPSATTSPDVLLVPGAFSGPWIYADVVERLAAQDVEAQVVALPSVGGPSTGDGFGADVAAVRGALDAVGRPVVLVAHSYGGSVITDAAAGPHPNVLELVYLCAAAPGSGASMASTTAAVTPEGQDSPIQVGDDGLASFPREVARQALFNDADDDRAAVALDQLRPQDMSGTDRPIETAAWTELPYVNVSGTADLVPRAVAPDFPAGAAQSVELPSGHCPQWTEPELVADLIVERLRTER